LIKCSVSYPKGCSLIFEVSLFVFGIEVEGMLLRKIGSCESSGDVTIFSLACFWFCCWKVQGNVGVAETTVMKF